ncbi:MAG: aspartate aminotransferase family protein [Thermoproteota archaeon]|nr:aspartate aminotransferase family protein [Thermoproteota archaeon]
MRYNNYKEIYEQKTKKSRSLYFRSTNVFPGGINHNIRFFEPYPFFTKAARGKYLFDVDDNEYTDYWMGHWALILGHTPDIVCNPLLKQIRKGILYGTTNELSLDLGETIQTVMPRAEYIRFSSTGSEATMYAVRLARAKTGRRVIAKVLGGWHGYNNSLMYAVNYPFEIQEGPGLIQEEERFIKAIPFNDLQKSLKILESVKDDLACIIVEPILGGAGCITPIDGYLQGLQEFAKKNDSLFILDEIVTGFRLSIHGATSIYKLEPDIFTLGKVVGGGFPIGVVCGDKDIMSVADPIIRKNKQNCCAIGGGTFSANPVTMTAGLATIRYLRKNKDIIYPKINNLGNEVRRGLCKVFSNSKINVEVTGTGSLFQIHFLNKLVSSIRTAEHVALSDRELSKKYSLALMANHGIFFLPLKMGAISEAHNRYDVKTLVLATESLLEMGFS